MTYKLKEVKNNLVITTLYFNNLKELYNYINNKSIFKLYQLINNEYILINIF